MKMEHDDGAQNQPQQARQKSQRPLDMSTMQLITEAQLVDPCLPEVHKVLIDEIERKSGKGEPDYIEVDIPKKIKISKKILVPTYRNPEFNYVGKLMGPGGSTLKKLQEKLGCRICVAGRGSSKNVNAEQQLLQLGDPKHRHFAENLHVRIDIFSTPVEGYRKLADVLDEIRAHFNTDLEDDISKSQISELGFNPSESAGGKLKQTLAPIPGGRGAYRGNLFRGRPPFLRGSARAPYQAAHGAVPGYAPRPNYGAGYMPAYGDPAQAAGGAVNQAAAYPGYAQYANPNAAPNPAEAYSYAGGDFRQLTAMTSPAYPCFQAPGAGEMPAANGSGADHASSGGKVPIMASGTTRVAYRMHPYVVGPPPPQHNPI